jgi:uncharacterized protein YutE (UPF0331/DUF86 family)
MAHGVISGQTSARLESLAGFRNVLVHEYAEVDPGGSWPPSIDSMASRHP